jgi:haloacetate dehalogenase
VFWGEKGIPSKTTGPLDIWKDWCERVEGRAMDSGHFIAEEAPDDTAKVILDFFKA